MADDSKEEQKRQYIAMLRKKFQRQDDDQSDEMKIGKSVQSNMSKDKAREFMKGFKKG